MKPNTKDKKRLDWILKNYGLYVYRNKSLSPIRDRKALDAVMRAEKQQPLK